MTDSGSTSSQAVLLVPTVSNFAFEFDLNLYEHQYKIMALCLRHSSLAPALSKTVTISQATVSEMVNKADLDKDNRRFKFNLYGREFRFTKEDFCTMLELPIPEETDNVTPIMILDMFNYMGHHPPLMMVSRFRNANVPAIWSFFFTVLYRCLTGATTSVDQANTAFYKILHHLVYGSRINVGEILWDEFVKSFRKKAYGTLPSPRFWALLTQFVYNRENFFIPHTEPLFRPPTFRTPVFVKTVEFPSVGVITSVMASRIEDALEPVFTDYTSHHEIPDVQIHHQPPPEQVPPRAAQTKSSKRKTTASASEPEHQKQKRVKILARKKGGETASSPSKKKKKTKKASKPMTPPRIESSDSEGTRSGHGAEEAHPDDPTNIEAESHHDEEVHTSPIRSSVPPRGPQSSGPNAPGAGGATKIVAQDEPSQGESDEGPSESFIKAQIVMQEAKDRAVQQQKVEAAAKAQEKIARVIRETRERTTTTTQSEATTSQTPSVSNAEARRALEQSIQIAAAKLLEIATKEKARLKSVGDHARRFAQAHLEEAQRRETEHIFKSALDQPIPDTVISSDNEEVPDKDPEVECADNEPIFEESNTSSPRSPPPEQEGDSSTPINRSDFNRLKRKLDVILQIIDRPAPSAPSASPSDITKVFTQMEAYTAQLSNLTQGLTLVNTKVSFLMNNLQQMISETVSSEISKLLLDDKFKTLQESVDSLVAEIRKETATIQSSFDKKSSEWDLIQAELVTRAKKEVELQEKLQNLKDQTNVLVRATTRTADMETLQEKSEIATGKFP